MITARSTAELRLAIQKLKKKKCSVGLVPTMGCLHEGHLSLIRKCREENGVTVVSIFVNPAQFGKNEDFGKYPRDIKRDSVILEKEKVDILYLPGVSDIYPEGCSTFVDPGSLSRVLCGRYRPGHFRGVATVVCILLNAAGPDNAYFGEKDMQQLVIIRKMARELKMKVDIKGVPLYHGKNGLAESSRNKMLSPAGLKKAVNLSRGLFQAREEYLKGTASVRIMLEKVKQFYRDCGIDFQYVEIRRLTDLSRERVIGPGSFIAVAAFVDGVRLIDNMKFE